MSHPGASERLSKCLESSPPLSNERFRLGDLSTGDDFKNGTVLPHSQAYAVLTARAAAGSSNVQWYTSCEKTTIHETAIERQDASAIH